MVALDCDMRLWRHLKDALFFQCNSEARPAIIAELERRISGGADPDTLPRGPASTTHANQLVKDLITQLNEDYSDAAGAGVVSWPLTCRPAMCGMAIAAATVDGERLKLLTPCLPHQPLPIRRRRREAGHRGQPDRGLL